MVAAVTENRKRSYCRGLIEGNSKSEKKRNILERFTTKVSITCRVFSTTQLNCNETSHAYQNMLIFYTMTKRKHCQRWLKI